MPNTPSSVSAGSYQRFVLPALLILALFTALWWRRPQTPPTTSTPAQPWTFQGRIFGTTYTIKTLPPSSRTSSHTSTHLHSQIKAVLQTVDMQMSTYNKRSELSRFNQHRQTKLFPVSSALVHVVAEAKRISKLTGGAFDVTIGPVVNVWGFGPKKRTTPPDDREITTARQQTGDAKLSFQLSPPALQKTLPHLYVDLSAIAKGYGVDAVALFLEKQGHSRYMVEIGGEVRAKGTNPSNQPWRIGIEKPQDIDQQDIELVIPLHNMSMATSGNYRNFIMVQGKRVPHIIDARTGIPVMHGLASVTVLHPSCMTADALATGMFVLGSNEGLRLAEREKLAVLFLEPQGHRFVSKASTAFQQLIQSQTNPRTIPPNPPSLPTKSREYPDF